MARVSRGFVPNLHDCVRFRRELVVRATSIQALPRFSVRRWSMCRYLVGDTVETGSARGVVEAIEVRTRMCDDDVRRHIIRHADVGRVVPVSDKEIAWNSRAMLIHRHSRRVVSRLVSQDRQARSFMTNPEDERAGLMRASREWAHAAASGDLERALAYWTDDAILLPPDQPAVVGKDAIRAWIRQASSIPGFSITWEPELATVSNGADVGYLVERNRMTFRDVSGELKTQYGKAVTVWRKQADGGWKCVIDTWNTSPVERVLAANGPGT